MNNFNYDIYDTIAAISTPFGKGAISIIRISGPATFQQTLNFFSSNNKSINIKNPGRYLGDIIYKNKKIDQVLLLSYKKPKSYTGEDLIELHCHGNPLLINTILNIITSFGVRPAQPGEFTLRAFLNNKMDLIQAEAINDLINAKTYLTMESAINNLNKRLSNKINIIDSKLKKLILQTEVHIDHFDEEYSSSEIKDIKNKTTHIINEINNLVKSYDINQQISKGINISIIGKTNVGKSSFFNLLIKRDKAIISSKPGTTRDLIEEFIELADCPVKLIDTAGIKKVQNNIEKEAIRRTSFSIEEANILLIVFDNSSKLNKNDYILMEQAAKKNVFKLIVINKCDLESRIEIEIIKKLFPKEKIFKISVSRETGINKIEKEIVSYIKKFDIKDNLILNNARHRNSLMNVNRYLNKLIKSINSNLYFDIISAELKKALNELANLTGKYTTEKMLEDVFSNFCIGK